LLSPFVSAGFGSSDTPSLLGFDTALASIEPHGAILPDTTTVCESGCNTAEPPNRLVIGSFVVGERDRSRAPISRAAFSETAHHFSVFVSTADVPIKRVGKRSAARWTLNARRTRTTICALSNHECAWAFNRASA
jgi:hypothetical protein